MTDTILEALRLREIAMKQNAEGEPAMTDEKQKALMRKSLVGKLRIIAEDYPGASTENHALNQAASRLELHEQITTKVLELHSVLMTSLSR